MRSKRQNPWVQVVLGNPAIPVAALRTGVRSDFPFEDLQFTGKLWLAIANAATPLTKELLANAEVVAREFKKEANAQ
jgi:hypothetical protein